MKTDHRFDNSRTKKTVNLREFGGNGSKDANAGFCRLTLEKTDRRQTAATEAAFADRHGSSRYTSTVKRTIITGTLEPRGSRRLSARGSHFTDNYFQSRFEMFLLSRHP